MSGVRVTGKWKVNRRAAGRAIYHQPQTRSAIAGIGEQAATIARNMATNGVVNSANKRGTMLRLPFQIRFKDVKRFYSPRSSAFIGTNAGTDIDVGLVVSDSSMSQALEYGGNGVPPVGYMRTAGIGVAASRSGVKFYGPNKKKRRR